MAARHRRDNRGGQVVIRKEEITTSSHYSGTWKIAYADFVTAMMAFFLLMWLINATTEDQRRGLADYFSPMNVLARNNSGNGAPFGGKTPFDNGSMVSDLGAVRLTPGLSPAPAGEQPDAAPVNPAPSFVSDDEHERAGEQREAAGNAPKQTDTDGDRAAGGGVAPSPAPAPQKKQEFLANAGAGTLPKPDMAAFDTGALRAELARRERVQFDAAARAIREAIGNDPALAELGRQVALDVTPEGLRIQLLDEDRQPMFATGSAVPNERARMLLHKIAPILAKLPQSIAVTGHTDAAPYKGTERSNWDLSSERAEATRRVLVGDGLPDDRFREISGHADRDLLLPDNPLAAANRRIAILVMASTPLSAAASEQPR